MAPTRWIATLSGVTLALSGLARAADVDLLELARSRLPALERAASAADAGRGGPDAVQVQYDAARDLQQALRGAEPVSAACRPLLQAMRAFARAQIMQAEGFDRPWPPLTSLGVRAATSAQAAIRRTRPACRPRPASSSKPRQAELDAPHSGEVFFGALRAGAPKGAAVADIQVGRHRFRVDVFNDRLVTQVPSSIRPGKYDVKVAFRYLDAKQTIVGTARSNGVWLLPPGAERRVAQRQVDRTLSSRLTQLARSFSGYSGIWVHDLTSGRVASWNADARFPAASTVKLAVLIAGLRRFGPRPERSFAAYDMSSLTDWSSNAATNRLLVTLGGSIAGGSQIAQDILGRIGASRSTFTGEYRLGTVVAGAGRVEAEPPRVSSRVTTARDLGLILYLIHSAAMGDTTSLRTLGLTLHEARVGLALLLSWHAPPPGDNAGNFRPGLGASTPVAQKNGWISTVRHTGAIVYTRNGPKILVLLTYRDAITLRDAQALGARVIAVAGT